MTQRRRSLNHLENEIVNFALEVCNPLNGPRLKPKWDVSDVVEVMLYFDH